MERPQGREDREGPFSRRGAGKAHLEEKIWKLPDHEPCTPGSDFRNRRDKNQPQMPPTDFIEANRHFVERITWWELWVPSAAEGLSPTAARNRILSIIREFGRRFQASNEISALVDPLILSM